MSRCVLDPSPTCAVRKVKDSPLINAIDSVPIEQSELLARSVAKEASSDECLTVASQWLEDCHMRHEPCGRYFKSSTRLPKRVVAICLNSGGTSLEARLMDTDDTSGRYTALSYCWGGPGIIVFNGATENTLRAGLDVSKFPATIRDAMTVTNRLGIPYMWVDCLCIQQDNDLDMGREAAQMQSVYRNAVVTLRAACTRSVQDSLFPKRPKARKHCAVRWSDPDQNIVYLRPGYELAKLTDRGTEIARRAWTLEEDLLAPRTLTFGTQQMWFECASGTFNEAGRHTTMREGYSSKKHLQKLYNESILLRLTACLARKLNLPQSISCYYPNLRYMIYGGDPDAWNSSYLSEVRIHLQGNFKDVGGVALTYFDVWRAIVKEYTTRTLTKRKDVLTALAGIAEAFHETHGDEYVAGLWQTDLIRSLGWTRFSVDHSLTDLPTPSERYLAPSWSWASITGKGVTFGFDSSNLGTFIPTARLVEACTEPSGPEVYGSLKSGHIVLRVPFLEVSDPFEEIRSGVLQAVRREIGDRLRDHSDHAHEFSQQHRPYEGQRFAIVFLCTNTDTKRVRLHKSILLLETSTETTWRRIGHFSFGGWENKAKRYMIKIVHHRIIEDPEDHVRARKIREEKEEAIYHELSDWAWDWQTVKVV
jgi:hypothetical protein